MNLGGKIIFCQIFILLGKIGSKDVDGTQAVIPRK
jgi:hypothetical protein